MRSIVVLSALSLFCSSQTEALGKKTQAAKSKEIKSADLPSNWRQSVAEGERRLLRQELPVAEDCFSQAVKEVKRDKSATADDLASCLYKEASVQRMQDMKEEAMSNFKKALKVLERAHGKKSKLLLPEIIQIAEINEVDGEYKRSLKIFQRAVEIAKVDPGEKSLTYAERLHELGRVQFESKQAKDAELSYSQALTLVMAQPSLESDKFLQEVLSDYIDMLEKTYGAGKSLPSSVRAELLKDRVGQIPRSRGVEPSAFEKEVSVRLAKEASAKAQEEEKLVPRDDQAKVELRSALPPIPKQNEPSGDFVALESINKQRVDFYERMIAIDVKSLGASHPSVARDLGGLGAIYLSQKKYGDAKPLYQRALKIYEASYGEDALLVKRTKTILQLIDEAMAPSDGTVGGELSDYVSTLPTIPLAVQTMEMSLRLNELALLLYSQGRLDDAARVYSWALSCTSRTTGANSILSACTLRDYARVLRSQGRIAEADRMDGDAHIIMRAGMAEQASRVFQ